MRTYPAGWPDPADPDYTAPKAYLHVVDSAWPPASPDADIPLPAGWAELGTWNIDGDLVGSLLPGQINAASGFMVATGKATFRHGLSLAPWKSGDEKVQTERTVEIVASYDGPTGSTAFLLATLELDPVSAKASERVLNLDLVDSAAGLDRQHGIRQFGRNANPWEHPFDPAAMLRQIAVAMGSTTTGIPDVGTSLTSNYFPGDKTWKECLQAILAANLAAGRVDADGNLVVLTYDHLSGIGATTDTLDVLDELADLEWVVDPAEKIDRVEVKYSPPDYAQSEAFMTTGELRDFATWVSPTTYRMLAGARIDYDFDPGAAVYVQEVIAGNTAKNGTGAGVYLLASDDPGVANEDAVERVSTGRIRLHLVNNTSGLVYRVDDDGKNTFLAATWRDIAGTDSAQVISWGASAENALRPLSLDFGNLIQNDADAQLQLDRIVSRVRAPSVRINSVSVVPDLRREIGDLVFLDYAEDGLSSKAIITGIKSAGVTGAITQSLDLVLLPPLVGDFNTAMDAAHPGWTIAAFNAAFAGKTIADFNEIPLDV